MSQFRQSPFTKEWVLIAPNPSIRPDQFRSVPVMSSKVHDYDSTCVFCTGDGLGNEVLRIPDSKSWSIKVIENKFSAEGTHGGYGGDSFFSSRAGVSTHEIIITKQHNKPLALSSSEDLAELFSVFKRRMVDLKEESHVSSVQIFHNYGRDAGASLLHPHSQLIALPLVPHTLHNQMKIAAEYFQHKKQCQMCAMLEHEKYHDERVIYESDNFIAIQPYASAHPFETWVVPKNHEASFEEIERTAELGDAIKAVSGVLHNRLSDPAITMYINSMPYARHKSAFHDPRFFHWHIAIFPRVAIWAGFEFATGIPVNPVVPEEAAKFLKA
jgi:UDPglucose--hexose-1-phosphate uridylyltransferase